jgi:non-canonical purine NTP pyrophosphatase (RdgB/HAM1 family)
MIEDTGLYIQTWNGLPGALVKWFLQRVGPEGICKMLQPYPDRSAKAKTIVATYDGHGEPGIFVGEVTGQIAALPYGDGGFGWDALFIPDGAQQTFAEMGPEEKDRYSMRRLAFEAMRDYYSGAANLKKERR